MNDVYEDCREYPIALNRFKAAFEQKRTTIPFPEISEPISQSHFNHYEAILPALYMRSIVQQHAAFGAASPEKIEKLLHIHFIQPNNFPILFKGIEEHAIALRLKLFKDFAQKMKSQ